jgi:2-polyprenyl-3-methyl-5-hydroxy-6-metoxy-1,4-benzoquinol methylase
MLSFLNLRRRQRQPEIMDQPNLERNHHFHALHGLSRLNDLAGTVSNLWPPLVRYTRQTQQPLRILDVASGAGDMLLGLAARAKRAGIELHLSGCDISPTALDYASQHARQAGANISFFRHDVLRDALPGHYNVVLCSLFLHHLEEAAAVQLLQRLASAADLVLLHDLRRDICGLLLTYAAAWLLTTSHVVHVDGPRSVRAAFTMPEVRQLARQAGLSGATVEPQWPCRLLLTWQRRPSREVKS